jgi:hypothetical protein
MSAFKIKRPERKISYLPELQRISSALRRLSPAVLQVFQQVCVWLTRRTEPLDTDK